MQNKNKPLLLRPSGKDYLWGGSRLNDEFEKNIDMDPLAETWECSTHPDGPSYVVSGEFGGQELAEVLRAHLFFIQAGTVHAIGAGALVAEIQENSNLKKSKQRSAKVQKNI